MDRKVAVLWLCAAMLASSIIIVVEIAPPARATTITVDDDGGADYMTINEALFVASDGDTIFVYSGIYNETLLITNTLTLIGENREDTIINGSGNGDVVIISEPWVNVTGFTITGSGIAIGDSGFEIPIFSDNCNISDNNIVNNRIGLNTKSNGNIFMNNNISSSTENAIDLSSSNGNLIFGNIMYNTAENAIYHSNSTGNMYYYNTFLSNSGSGLYLSSSTGNIVEGNSFINNSYGIATWESVSNVIIGNTLDSNTEKGIYLQTNSDNNNVLNNIAYNNNDGISLFLSIGNNITGNNASNNVDQGISLSSSIGNNITDNNCSMNGDYGIHLQDSNENNFINNIAISNNNNGIYLLSSNGNNIVYNIASLNNNRGVGLYNSDDNNVFWNIATSNTEGGIHLYSSNTNTITGNNVSLNDNGIYFSLSSNNRIYHNNIIDNNNQAFDNGNNQWDDGYPSGGNFWSDWTSPDDYSGPDQDEPGSDGIVDEPRVLESPTGRDDYPFTTPNGWVSQPGTGPVYNTDSNEYFDTIQQAIDDANTLDGHTIEVSAGTYNENVFVDKAVNLIGEDQDTTIIDGGGVGDVVRITADLSSISGFTVRDSGPNGSPRDAGIEVNSAHQVTISNSMFSSNRDAIYLYNSNYSYITDNNVNDFEGIHVELSSSTAITGNILSNEYSGIYLDSSISIEITDNTMIGNGFRFSGNSPEYWNTHDIDTSNTVNGKPVYYWKNRTAGTVPSGAGQVILASCTNVVVENQVMTNCYIGIILGYSDNNIISNNNASSNKDNGMYLFYSHNNLIESNTFLDNMEGIFIGISNGNNITGNHFSDNAGGMVLVDSDGNIISDNTVSGNLFGVMLIYSNGNNISDNHIASNWAGSGIYLGFSSDNIITKNTLFDNKYGINITDSNNNKIYHNNLTGNTYQASDDTISGNQWDNGYPSGGNYWDDYSGSDSRYGPNQDMTGSDGIGDTPFEIDSDSLDNYPLIAPWGEDTIPPEIELTEPSNNSVVKPGIIIDLTISDINLHEVTCSINGGPYQILVSPYDIDTMDWGDGNYRIDVRAEDTSDNTNTASFNIIIDSTPPMISLDSPFNGSFVDSTPEIELTISDVNLDAVSYSVNSGTQLPLFEPYIVDGSSWPEGENILAIQAIDQAGNSNERWFVFTKDSFAPEIVLISPENGSLLTDSLTIDFEVSDEHLKSVIYSINQGSFTTLEEPYELDTAGWNDGEHIITIKADDAAGQMNERWYLFTIDTSPPSIDSTSIIDNAEGVDVDTEIVIEFSEPMDTEAVESAISIDPYIEYTCIWKNDNKTMTLEFQTPLEYDTQYTVTIGTNAEDSAGSGLESAFELEFTTEVEQGGGGDGGDGFPFLYLLLAIISALAVAIIVSALVMSKRKKGSKASVSTPIEIARPIQVTCSSCGNLLSVNDMGTTMNVSCPFCSTLLTVPSQRAAAQMLQPQTQPEIQPSSMQISCPQCRFVFSIEKTGGPTRVQCPNCGVAGTMNT